MEIDYLQSSGRFEIGTQLFLELEYANERDVGVCVLAVWSGGVDEWPPTISSVIKTSTYPFSAVAGRAKLVPQCSSTPIPPSSSCYVSPFICSNDNFTYNHLDPVFSVYLK